MLKREAALDRMFHALADPSRRDMVRRLARRPEPVSELARPYAMSMSAVVQHLKVLEASGLVRSEKAAGCAPPGWCRGLWTRSTAG